MGADVAPATGSDFTSWKSVVHIASRHWRLGTTGICHSGGELCQLSSSGRVTGILPYRYPDRMQTAAAYSAGNQRFARLEETLELAGRYRYRRIGRPYPRPAPALAGRSGLWSYPTRQRS